MINKPCVYCIENTIDNKKYIGQTVNPSVRKRQHFLALKKGKHPNPYMQNAYNKYGKKSFLFKVLIYCEPFELTKYEQTVVNSISSESLYNLCLECVDNPMLGKKHSEETKKKMSEEKVSENNPMYGKKHSEQTKALMSKRAFEKNYMRGRKLSPEERKRLSEITKGENSGNAKLTKVQVDEIRKIRKNYTLKELSNMFNVSTSTISAICLNKLWVDNDKKEECNI